MNTLSTTSTPVAPTITNSIKISKATQVRSLPENSDLGFGKIFTDHMFTVKFNNGHWENPEITPYSSLQLDPGSSVLHYGQALFEGMKAFKQDNGDIVVFRPEFNWNRMTKGAARLCMPMIPESLFWDGLQNLISVDRDWVPNQPGSSLYIRPTLIGTEAFLGVRPSNQYLFFVILSPVGSYYGGSQQRGVKIWVEQEFVRAAPGGLGETKAAANYANSLYAAHRAKEQGYAQVLWLDVQHQNVEEVGTMNVFFVFENEIVTPSLDGTILQGGVRNSVITLLKDWNLPVVERKLSLSEIRQRSAKNELKEVFGTGTAAVITPVEELSFKGEQTITLPQQGLGPIALRLYTEIQGLQYGRLADTRQWIKKII